VGETERCKTKKGFCLGEKKKARFGEVTRGVQPDEEGIDFQGEGGQVKGTHQTGRM